MPISPNRSPCSMSATTLSRPSKDLLAMATRPAEHYVQRVRRVALVEQHVASHQAAGAGMAGQLGRAPRGSPPGRARWTRAHLRRPWRGRGYYPRPACLGLCGRSSSPRVPGTASAGPSSSSRSAPARCSTVPWRWPATPPTAWSWWSRPVERCPPWSPRRPLSRRRSKVAPPAASRSGAGWPAVPADAEIVVVHDAARPFATAELYARSSRRSGTAPTAPSLVCPSLTPSRSLTTQ